MRRIHKFRALAVVALVALTGTACSSGSSSKSSNGPVTLTWWHNGTTDPVRSTWDQVAADYHKTHPKVTLNINRIQNEQFQTKVPLALQGSTPPDLYQQWGGGDEASQIKSGKVADITSNVSSWIGQLGKVANVWKVNGKVYGVPYDWHVVGFWYRKDLFANAGITAPPTTLDELNTDVTKLKAAGIAPIAIGSKDRWPDAFYYDYFAVRECSVKVLKDAGKTNKLTDACWTKAGDDLKSFLATNPFQQAFLGTPAQQGAGSSAGLVAAGKAAMELQGDWELSTILGLTNDNSIPAKLGWFPFPSISGGGGDPNAVLGGGDGFSCTTKHAADCAEFLKYVASVPVQKKLAAAGFGLPSNPGAASAITDSSVKAVWQASQNASYAQQYFDRYFPTNVGQALNDSIANFFAGQGTPQTIVQSVNNAASGNK